MLRRKRCVVFHILQRKGLGAGIFFWRGRGDFISFAFLASQCFPGCLVLARWSDHT